jgi:hypothetical protein
MTIHTAVSQYPIACNREHSIKTPIKPVRGVNTQRYPITHHDNYGILHRSPKVVDTFLSQKMLIISVG